MRCLDSLLGFVAPWRWQGYKYSHCANTISSRFSGEAASPRSRHWQRHHEAGKNKKSGIPWAGKPRIAIGGRTLPSGKFDDLYSSSHLVATNRPNLDVIRCATVVASMGSERGDHLPSTPHLPSRKTLREAEPCKSFSSKTTPRPLPTSLKTCKSGDTWQTTRRAVKTACSAPSAVDTTSSLSTGCYQSLTGFASFELCGAWLSVSQCSS